MKKLLFFLSFIVACNIGLSQTTVTLQGGQFGISSLQPIAAFSLVGNPTGSPAVPQTIQLGYGLIFQGNKIAVDSTIKDSIFTVNGLQTIGAGFRSFGLGGFLSMNTTISGSNNWDMTIDSMQAKVGSGFRVNFGNDLPYDMFYRDSATGHWKNFPKGGVGQVLGMLGTGGIGWVTIAGGGSLTLTTTGTSGAATLIGTTLNIPVYAAGVSTVGAFSGSSIANGASISGTTITFGPADGTNPGMVKPSGTQTFGPTITFTNAPILTTSSTVGYVWTATGTGGQGGWSPATGGGGGVTIQRVTGGSSGTVTGSNYFYLIDPASTLSTYAATFPASPTDGQIVIFAFGGTITSGPVVTSFTLVMNLGQGYIDSTFPLSATTVTADNTYEYRWVAANSKWHRFKP